MQRNVMMGGIAVVALVAAIVIFTRGSATEAAPKEFSFRGVCLSCQKDCERKAPLGTRAPYTCEACGKSAVYQWYYCSDCKKRFVPDLVRFQPGEPLRIPPETSCPCPTCRSRSIGQYDPLFADGENGVAPLPKWEP